MHNGQNDPAGGFLPWNSTALGVPSDRSDSSGRRARYRLLQSWYRENCLGLPRYGKSQPGGRWVGSMLHEEDVRSDESLNLMHEAASYTLKRVAEVNDGGGSAETHRLTHNLLSSMPLCFSIFGTLHELHDKGLDLVSALFDAEADEVEWVECEWKPSSNPLNDRTAFDAALMVRREDGTRHLIGVETKYTEPFSQREYLTPRYVEVHREVARRRHSGWFRPDIIPRLAGTASNQLWRNMLLAICCERRDDVDRASVVVLALEGDAGADSALNAVKAGLRHDQLDRCRSVSLEALADAAAQGLGPGRGWAERFTARYLDLTPVGGLSGADSAP